jgi:CRP/FNR family cyclic AMP-dependent transcriptional regulator
VAALAYDAAMSSASSMSRPGASGDPLAGAALRACPLFAGVSDEALATVGAALRQRRFRRGETIFHAGDPGDALYLVTSGKVKITIPSDDGSEPVILTTIDAGGFFGALALLDGAQRSATAVALDAVEASLLRRDAFDRLLDTEPDLRRALLATLAGEIRRLTAQVEDLHFLDLPGRLARHLLRVISPDAGPLDVPSGEHRLPWPYTQGELAGMIGASRQSVNRLLADFVADGLLRFEGDVLVIPDAGRLAAAARR